MDTSASVTAGTTYGIRRKLRIAVAPFIGCEISMASPSPRSICPSTDQKVHLQVFQKYCLKSLLENMTVKFFSPTNFTAFFADSEALVKLRKML